MTQRERFAAGKILAKKDELALLERAVELARLNFDRAPHHAHEIDKARAEQRLEDFRAANPQLVGSAA